MLDVVNEHFPCFQDGVMSVKNHLEAFLANDNTGCPTAPTGKGPPQEEYTV